MNNNKFFPSQAVGRVDGERGDVELLRLCRVGGPWGRGGQAHQRGLEPRSFAHRVAALHTQLRRTPHLQTQ